MNLTPRSKWTATYTNWPGGFARAIKKRGAMENFRTLASKFPTSRWLPNLIFISDPTSTIKKNMGRDHCLSVVPPVQNRERDSGKAAYKLAWSHYKQDQFKEAGDQFSNQVKRFPEGDLVADGLFMMAESLYRMKDYEAALQAYKIALPAVAQSTLTEPKIQWLARIHAAQSANQIKQHQETITLVQPFENNDPKTSPAGLPMREDAMLELGMAYSGLRNSEKALNYFSLAAKSEGKRALGRGCMIAILALETNNSTTQSKNSKKSTLALEASKQNPRFGHGRPMPSTKLPVAHLCKSKRSPTAETSIGHRCDQQFDIC